MLRKVLLLSTILFSASGSAHSADLPYGTLSPYAAGSPVFTWTGPYVGINGGYGWSKQRLESVSYAGVTDALVGLTDRSMSLAGGTVGTTLGFNLQSGAVTYGVEGDLNWADIRGARANLFGTGAGLNAKLDYFGTLRGRLGYAIGPVLPFVTGGLFWADARVTGTYAGLSISAKNSSFGWTIGGGLEYVLTRDWSVKGEYLFARLDNTSFSYAGATAKIKGDLNIVRAGLNYIY